MIVNYTEQGWEIITQRAHGLLAAQIAMHWKTAQRPQRWAETVVAIAGHDDAQTELRDTDLLTPQGGPVNFAMKLYEAERCRRSLDFALSRSRYSALLASMHLVFLHHKEGQSNSQAKAFLEEQEQLQTKWRSELNMSEAEAKQCYALVEWCDAFSLLLCRNEVQPEQRIIEISRIVVGEPYLLTQNDDTSLNVSPWPFEEDSFDVQLETRTIPQLQFKDADEFKQAFLKAEVVEKRWTLKLTS